MFLGSNFLCASAKFDASGELVDLAEGPFDNIVIDMRNGLLGFDVNDAYPLPSCGDAEHPQPSGDFNNDCKVNFLDLYALTGHWLLDNCGSGNDFCNKMDIDENGRIDLVDYAFLANQWLNSPFNSVCGDAEHPWPKGDLNRDCSVNSQDLRILAEEWLGDCNWLNWNCRGSELNSDGIVNFVDYAEFVQQMRQKSNP